MSYTQKWYENKGILAVLILTIFPIGLLGIWLRQTNIVKKIAYSFVGFWGWIFTMFFVFVLWAAIFFENDYYQLGEEAYREKDYVGAVDYYSRVSESDSNYVAAQKKIVAIKKVQEQERLTQKTYREQALKEVRNNVSDLIAGKNNYSVILYDMNFEVGTDTTYQHQYKVIVENENFIPKDTLTDLVTVSDTTFNYYAEDLEMEILSKNQNEEITYSAPPGYNRYVGNTRYGEWKQDSSGDSFWEFYGKYAFLRTMFGYQQPIYNVGYYDYIDSYKGKSSYYGRYTSSGKFAYGTSSPHTLGKTNRLAFSSKVQSRVSRSSATNKYSSKSSFSKRSNSRSSSYRTSSRSGSRYSSASSRSSSSRGGK